MLFKRRARVVIFVPAGLLLFAASLAGFWIRQVYQVASLGARIFAILASLLFLALLGAVVDSIRWLRADMLTNPYLRTPFRKLLLPAASSFRVSRTHGRGGWRFDVQVGRGGDWESFADFHSEQKANHMDVQLTRWRLENATSIEATRSRR
jgi:hypothetical protein